jgi:glycosyltransferase involved in cell wall biosynthesis
MYVLAHGKPSLLWRFFQGCYIANTAKRYGVQHFHAHFATRPTTVAFFSSMITGHPFSFTAHAMDLYKNHLSKKSLSKKIKKARFVITVSDYNKKHLSQIASNNNGKIVKIYNGINLTQFRPNGVRKRSIFTFVCVARFVEKKGHRVLIEACEILHERGLDFRCWLVGKGKLRSQINSDIKKKNLKRCVKLLGPLSQTEVVECYGKVHALVLPCIVGSDGNRDGLPVSIVEALASGLPVITTPMTGNPEVVKTNHNGILIPFDNSNALADAMEKLIQDSDFYQQLKTNARTSVESRFDIHQTTRILHNLFAETLS